MARPPGVSVVQLYAGAFFPGFMLAFLYIGYVIVLAKWRPELMPPLSAEGRRVELPALFEDAGGAAAAMRCSDCCARRAAARECRRAPRLASSSFPCFPRSRWARFSR